MKYQVSLLARDARGHDACYNPIVEATDWRQAIEEAKLRVTADGNLRIQAEVGVWEIRDGQYHPVDRQAGPPSGNTQIPLQVIMDATYDTDLKIRESYSGRVMYGETCFGVVGSRADFFVFLTALAGCLVNNDLDPDLAIDLGKAAQTDSMGLDAILYFPGFEIERESYTVSGDTTMDLGGQS